MVSNEEQQKQLIKLCLHDEAFVEKLSRTVQQHLADETFGVEKLSSEMCMSRMNLYRRMQTVMGQSPSAYIKAMRLKRAVEIIESRDLPINDVATMTGFSSAACFSKCFREQYGKPPSQWKKA